MHALTPLFFRFCGGYIRLAIGVAVAALSFPLEVFALGLLAYGAGRLVSPVLVDAGGALPADQPVSALVTAVVVGSFAADWIGARLGLVLLAMEAWRIRFLCRLGLLGRALDMLVCALPVALFAGLAWQAHGDLRDPSVLQEILKDGLRVGPVAIGALALMQLCVLRRRLVHQSAYRQALASGQSGARGSRALPATFAGKAFAIDGDTLAVGDTRIRIWGIDAPEIAQTGGAEARDHLRSMTGDRTLEFLPVELDKYDRLVARVLCAGADIGQAMVREGYAIAAYAEKAGADGKRGQAYAPAEAEARQARAGLWGRFGGIASPQSFRKAS